MNLLVAGVTGQLGAGVVEAASTAGVGIVPLVRPLHGRSGRDRLERLFPDHPELAEVAIEGDVTAPLWGLDEATLDLLAPEVDAVLNLAAETNWNSTAQRLTGTNVVGAVAGRRVAAALARRHPRCAAYCYASSVYAAGGRTGDIPEERFGPDAGRTAYEQSKWLAEEALIDDPDAAGPPVGIARIGGLLGNSRTGRTARRNSLYLLADRIDRLPARIFPFAPRGRVDMMPRDWAGALLLRFVGSVARLAARGPVIVHICAGEGAPTVRSLFEALQSVDHQDVVGRVRLVPVPEGVLWGSLLQAQRLVRLPPGWQNAVIGLRYMALDRAFERARLERVVPEPLPAPTAELIVRLAFDLRAGPRPRSLDGDSLARFGG